jgi:hypothetical protein
MKQLILVSLLALTACKEQESTDQDSKNPKGGPPQQMVATQGCSLSKTKGVVSIHCADGSSASGDLSTLHVQDANGADLSNITFLTNYASFNLVVFNKTSGNVLAYDGDGARVKITKVLFDADNCFGNAYAAPSTVIIKNTVLSNDSAWPTNTQAFKIIGASGNTYINIRSYYQAGVCTALISPLNRLARIEPTSFDSSDPLTIAQPLTVVNE